MTEPLSASSVDRVMICPPSAVLRPRTDEASESALRGTAIHEFLRRVALDQSQREIALECVPLEWVKTCQNLDLDTPLGDLTVVGTEEAYAIDAATGDTLYLGTNIDRKYNDQCKKLYNRDLLSTEVCVSLDVEAVSKAGQICCLDWKSGVQVKLCSEMWQMKLQAYVLAVKYDAPEVLARVAYVREDGTVWFDEHLFNRMDLDDIPKQLMVVLDNITTAWDEIDSGEVPKVYPGDHCKYCPALRGCPAQTALVRAALSELTTIDSNDGLLSVDQIGAAYARYKQIEVLAEKVKSSLRLMIENAGGEVPSRDGYVYRMSERSKTSIPADAMRGLLAKYEVPTDEIVKATKTSKFSVISEVKVKT